MLLLSPRLLYAIAGLSSLYLAAAPLFSSFHTPITFFRVALWAGAILLLIAAIFPTHSNMRFAIMSPLFLDGATAFGFFGSSVTTALLLYGVTRFIALPLGYLHGKVQLVGAYQPTMFDRLNGILSKPVLLTLLISSVASLLVSGSIILRMSHQIENAAPPR